jgi:hypothetical protein
VRRRPRSRPQVLSVGELSGASPRGRLVDASKFFSRER